jgi:hypothetical protein
MNNKVIQLHETSEVQKQHRKKEKEAKESQATAVASHQVLIPGIQEPLHLPMTVL